MNNIYSRDAHEVEAVISGLMATDDTVYHIAQVAELCAALVRHEGQLTVDVVPDDAAPEASAPDETVSNETVVG